MNKIKKIHNPIEEINENKVCIFCGKELVIMKGNLGRFLRCKERSCTFIYPLSDMEELIYEDLLISLKKEELQREW